MLYFIEIQKKSTNCNSIYLTQRKRLKIVIFEPLVLGVV